MSLKSRLGRLERILGRVVDECPNPIVSLILSEEEAADPDMVQSEGGAPCPNCGQVHVLVIHEEIVDAEESATKPNALASPPSA